MTLITPIAIKTADGSYHLQGTHRGDVIIDLFDDYGQPQSMTVKGALYCKGISANLISAARLTGSV